MSPAGRRWHTALPVAGLVGVLVLGGDLVARPLTGHDPTRIVTAPWASPRPGLPLGADGLGRDVLARVLAGGVEPALVALVAALAATTLGTACGLWAGWSQHPAARALLAGSDLLLALPLLLLVLLAAVALPGPAAVVVGTVLGGAPLTARLVAAATRDVANSGYVEAALVRGERTGAVLVREVLPAQTGLVGADLGLRAVLALQLATTLAVLGFGPPPPAPDWAVMLRENLPGLTLNAWGVLAPALALALLAGTLAAATRAGRDR